MTRSGVEDYEAMDVDEEGGPGPQRCRFISPANQVWGYIGIAPSVHLSLCLSRVNLTFALTFEPREIRLSYYTFVPCDTKFLFVPKILTS